MTPATTQRILMAAVVCTAFGAGHAQVEADRSDAAIVLEIERLLTPDATIADNHQQRQALLASLRKVPALVEVLERKFPRSQYRPAAYSLAIDALILRRRAGDPTVGGRQMSRLARKLLSVADDDEFRAKARFVLLEVAAAEVFSATTTTTSRPTTSPAAAKKLAAIAGKYVRLTDELPKTAYAAAALFQGGGIYLEAGRDDAALAVLERLSRDYPKDPFSLNALMILVQLYERRGQDGKALRAKRKVVEGFSGSAAAIKYRADIARAECLGKPFFLRFRSVRGRRVSIRDYRGKTVLVYFYASVVAAEQRERILREMSALAALAGKRGGVLLTVGADGEDEAEAVARILNAKGIDAPNLLDPESKVAQNYGVLFVPAVAIVSPKGVLKDIVTGGNIVSAVKGAIAPPTTRRSRPPAS